eukprot:6213059-Pleurochrysis_carterae.AAC.2
MRAVIGKSQLVARELLLTPAAHFAYAKWDETKLKSRAKRKKWEALREERIASGPKHLKTKKERSNREAQAAAATETGDLAAKKPIVEKKRQKAKKALERAGQSKVNGDAAVAGESKAVLKTAFKEEGLKANSKDLSDSTSTVAVEWPAGEARRGNGDRLPSAKRKGKKAKEASDEEAKRSAKKVASDRMEAFAKIKKKAAKKLKHE